MKRFFSAILTILFVITTFVVSKSYKVEAAPTNAYTFFHSGNQYHIDYFKDTGKIYYAAEAKTASTSTRFRTLGFQVLVKRGGKKFFCRFKLGSDYLRQVDSRHHGGYTYTMWAMDLNSGDSDLISYLEKHFPNDKKIFESIPYSDKTELELNAIITINEIDKKGVSHLQGSMYDNGNTKGEIYLTQLGYPDFKTSGIKSANSSWDYETSYDTKHNGIHGARAWPSLDFSSYFGIPLTINPPDVRVTKTVKAYYKDWDSGKNIIPPEKIKTLTVLESDKVKVSVHYQRLTGYKFLKSYLRYDGKTKESEASSKTKTRTIYVKKSNKSHDVIFYYQTGIKPTKPGDIKFDPDGSDDWTNDGKIGDGKGKYPVKVYYKGNDPVTQAGSVSVNHKVTTTDKKGKKTTTTTSYTVPVGVEYTIDHINVSGAVTDTINGKSGTVYLHKEGDEQYLHAKGYFKKSKVNWPTIASTEDSIDKSSLSVEEPKNPTEDSDEYLLDWTKPPIEITPSADNKWHNDNPYNIHVKVSDLLSGIDSVKSMLSVIDNSHYKHMIFNDEDADSNDDDNTGSDTDDSKATNVEAIHDDFDEDVSLDKDGMYSVKVNAADLATNKNSEKKETYLVDSTQPDVDFSVEPGIFSESNGAVRKESKKGLDFAYYGKLSFADNLSGVASVAYSWTYGEADGGTYETVYTSQYTTTDRYGELVKDDAGNMTGTKGEVNTAEIEKPVGDNEYLHVKEFDTAGNETDATFGPYEDPIKMRDFQVNDIRDPLWDSVFWKDSNYTESTGVSYKANQLPIDKNSHPAIKNAAPKLGYSFYFSTTRS
ncbi:hypothetical protein [Clostridium oryzae]|uniref:Uncharacterized protein n=1 Tax=Clostridium oryzae TaxID=1450648 RepID=A0A1V4IKX0_9CLOT|nr:hypothetical protein [Clostridium oryzae]OPJ60671.1 hypothetical protein CLORY_27220 [Clostridium oryzae]